MTREKTEIDRKHRQHLGSGRERGLPCDRRAVRKTPILIEDILAPS